MKTCGYEGCTAKAKLEFRDVPDAEFCELHFNVILGQNLEALVQDGSVLKIWDEEAKQYVYRLAKHAP